MSSLFPLILIDDRAVPASEAEQQYDYIHYAMIAKNIAIVTYSTTEIYQVGEIIDDLVFYRELFDKLVAFIPQ